MVLKSDNYEFWTSFDTESWEDSVDIMIGNDNGNDNLVFTSGNSGKIVDYGGLAFQTVGGSDIDIYYDFVDNHVYASNSSVGNPYTTVKPDRELLDVTLTPAAAPAPGPVPGGGIISLLGLGFAWSASRFRRSRREARSANGDCPCGVA